MALVRPLLHSALGLAFTVWAAVTLVFVATRLIGDPAVLLLPIGAGAEDLARLRHDLGLDQPLWAQYFTYLAQAVRGDFGISFQQGRPAMELVLSRLPATFSLSLAAFVTGLAGGLALAFASLSRSRLLRAVSEGASALGQAMPGFWLAMMLIMILAVQLPWLPTGGGASPAHLILPTLTLAAPIAASIARLLRSSLLETLGEDFIRTARAKGLSPRRILWRHILPNSLGPVLPLSGLIVGELLGGAIVIETVFAWPGLGRLLIQAISARDFPVVQAAVLVIAILYVLANLFADLIHRQLDPRLGSRED